MSLYRSNKSVEQSINLQIIGDAYGNELLEKYKKRIYKIFNPWEIEKEIRLKTEQSYQSRKE